MEAETPAPVISPIARALREEIRTLLDQERFGAEQLFKIKALAEHGSTLLALVSQTDAVDAAIGKLRQPDLSGIPGFDAPGNTESAGQTMVRELVSGLGELMRPPPAPIAPPSAQYESVLADVEAIASAKREGLTDLVGLLQRRLEAKLKGDEALAEHESNNGRVISVDGNAHFTPETLDAAVNAAIAKTGTNP